MGGEGPIGVVGQKGVTGAAGVLRQGRRKEAVPPGQCNSSRLWRQRQRLQGQRPWQPQTAGPPPTPPPPQAPNATPPHPTPIHPTSATPAPSGRRTSLMASYSLPIKMHASIRPPMRRREHSKGTQGTTATALRRALQRRPMPPPSAAAAEAPRPWLPRKQQHARRQQDLRWDGRAKSLNLGGRPVHDAVRTRLDCDSPPFIPHLSVCPSRSGKFEAALTGRPGQRPRVRAVRGGQGLSKGERKAVGGGQRAESVGRLANVSDQGSPGQPPRTAGRRLSHTQRD